MKKWNLSKNQMMLMLTVSVVVLSIIVHILHRSFGFLEGYLSLQGITSPLGSTTFLVMLSLVVPIVLLICTLVLHYRQQNHHALPMLFTVTLTAASISLIAGGNGLVEYHFSIFMVIAIISSFQSIRLILTSTVLFAIHHLAGYFLFPEILCGTANYSFSLLMIHAVFLLLTSGATILITSNYNATQQQLTQENELSEQQLKTLIKAMRTESEQLNILANGIKTESEQTSHSSHNISNAIQKLELNAQEASTSMEQAVQQNNDNLLEFKEIHSKTSDVVSQAKNSLHKASEGKHTIHHVSEQMSTITSTISSINLLIETLANQSGEITKLLNVIHSISEQTQLLALNASIEAARAGEHGKGFSVVASEIRNLATGTQNSAKEIDEVMANIQQQIDAVATRMQNGMSEIHEGNTSIALTEHKFDEIVESITEVENNIEAIAHSTNYLIDHTKQSLDLFENIVDANHLTVRNIAVISEAGREQLSTVDNLNDAIQSLHSISDEMQKLMKQIQ